MNFLWDFLHSCKKTNYQLFEYNLFSKKCGKFLNIKNNNCGSNNKNLFKIVKY